MSGQPQTNTQENSRQQVASSDTINEENVSQAVVSQEAGPDVRAETTAGQIPTSSEDAALVEAAPAIEVDIDTASDSGYGGSDGCVELIRSFLDAFRVLMSAGVKATPRHFSRV